MGHRARDDEVNGCDRPLDCWAHASSDGRIGGGGGGALRRTPAAVNVGLGLGVAQLHMSLMPRLS